MTDRKNRTDEVAPNVFRLEQMDGRRLLCQFVVATDDRVVIVDAGLPDTPRTSVLPFLAQLRTGRLRHQLVLTHPDADHCGGTAALREALPDLVVTTHRRDAELVGSPERTLQLRYEAYTDSDGITLSESEVSRIRGRLGAGYEVDNIVDDDAWIPASHPRALIVHLPGHSAGHLGLWIPELRTLIAGDAIMGRGIRNCDGSLLYPPQFLSPTTYRTTIRRIRSLGPELLLLAHEAPLRGQAVAAMLDGSAAAVAELETLVEGALSRTPATLQELCMAVHRGYGGLPAGRAGDLAMSVSGILSEMCKAGKASADVSSRPRRYRAGP